MARAGRGHGFVGKLYIALCYLAAAGYTLMALLILVMPLASEARIRETAEPVQIVVGFGAVILLAIACARGVQRFRRWGWWLATGVSAAVVLGCVTAMLMPTEAADPSSVRTGALFIIACHVPFLLYFWSRRRDFGMAR
ncbi:MAG TPA: hypothetical protein VLK84_14760 [Longimicrobium sp.]|nr:hypothetical protein [Longimicrobium sp.]